MARINEKAGEVSFGRALKDFFVGYIDFNGQTTRVGYWWVKLIEIILIIGFYIWLVVKMVGTITKFAVEGGTSGISNILATYLYLLLGVLVIGLALLLPNLALGVRRYRDAGLRGRGTLVIWLLALTCSYTRIISAIDTINSLNANLVSEVSHVTVDSGSTTLLTFVSLLLSLGLFVISLLPTDVLATRSSNPILLFFLRQKEDKDGFDAQF